MWQFADEANLPRVIFVSKLDRDNADFARAMESLTETFGRKCVAVQVPIGSEQSFSGSVNLLDADADVPDELADAVEEARELLTEAVAETDDDLTMKYLEGEEITPDEMRAGLKAGIASGDIVPVFAGNSLAQLGTAELMDALLDFMPSPAEVGSVVATIPGADDEIELECDGTGPLAALVFKTAADPFVGKLSYFRVYSGTFASDSQIWNANASEGERVGQVFVLTGKTQDATGRTGGRRHRRGVQAQLDAHRPHAHLARAAPYAARPQLPGAGLPHGGVPQVQGGRGQDDELA